MNIFVDQHHQGLLYSLHLLFEKRLGWTMYRPIGLEWYEKGFWSVYNHPDTAKQYLMDGYIPKDGTPPLNGISRMENGIHIIRDTTHHSEQRAITFDQFKDMTFDIVLASIPAHIEPFRKLIREYQPQAKFVFQMGNMFTDVMNNLHEIPNLLSSTIPFSVPTSCNAVFYHQEFDTGIFAPSGIKPDKSITSFINLLPQTNHGHYFYQLEQELPEYSCKSYGILCRDGIISGIDTIASIMRQSRWGFHAKWGGDGFGHVLYNWFASGRPVITCLSDYKDKLGGELLTDGETCLDLESYDLPTAISLIRTADSQWEYMSQQAYKRFCEKVRYDDEEQKIREWIGRLHD